MQYSDLGFQTGIEIEREENWITTMMGLSVQEQDEVLEDVFKREFNLE